MRTDDLIDMLSTNVERMDTRRINRNLKIALVSGLILALVGGVAALGVRWDIQKPGVFLFLIFKLGFGAIIVILGYYYLLKHARPGGETRSWTSLTAVPFIAIMALAAVSLSSAPSSHWERIMVGQNWLDCLLSIPIIAVLPFSAIMWAVRKAAPTHLIRTGALVGLVAGGISAMAYALHCTDDTLPFVAFWYSGTIVLCTLAGALIGPRLLRW